MTAAVEFETVSKLYRLGQSRTSLREAIQRLPARVLGQASRNGREHDALWALKDVSFRLERGQALGVVGRNGAGKTTLLKLLSRVTQPTAGRISVNGRISALIELGAGFHPDLTGRENVYLNGVILGMTRQEIGRKFDSIVEFAGLARFIDTPVKRYSSGMYARLGFAVAAHSDPDVLVVDEVLAVGDVSFQEKCLAFIHSYVNGGHTAVFVSHNLYAIEQLCQQLVWIDGGQVVEAGTPGPVLEKYLTFTQKQEASTQEPSSYGCSGLEIRNLRVADAAGSQRQVFYPGEDIVIRVEYRTERPIRKPYFCIWVSDSIAPSPLFAANMLLDGNCPESIERDGSVQCTFKGVPLMPRTYYVWLEVWDSDRSGILFRWQQLARFRVDDPTLSDRATSHRGSVRFSMSHAPIRVPYDWRFD